jgi:mRNA interferase MazF
VSRGDIWMYRFGAPDKRRPVLVLSRQVALAVMETALVAGITSTRRGLPTEVLLDETHGLRGPCAANLDHVYAVPQRELRKYVATLPPELMAMACEALAIATGC